MHMLKPHKIRA